MKLQDLIDKHWSICEQERELIVSRGKKYDTSDQDVLTTFKMASSITGLDTKTVIKTMIAIKIARLMQKQEIDEDSVKDARNYLFYLLV